MTPRMDEGKQPPGRWAYLPYPAYMAAFMGLSVWCFQQGFDSGIWIPALTVFSFIVILALEQLFPRRPSMNTLRDWQSINDSAHGVLTGVMRPIGTSLGIVILASLSEFRLATGIETFWPSHWNVALQIVLAQFVGGFAAYWVHRSMHEYDRLWWFHSIHHDTEQVHVLKSGRFHFMDEIYGALITPLPLLLLGVSTEVIILSSMWQVFNGSMGHANTQQRFPSCFHYLFSTVDLHNLHHSSERRYHDSNYSGTPIWDILFGTFRHPDRCHSETFGIAERYVPRGFFSQLWFPFRAQVTAPQATEPSG